MKKLICLIFLAACGSGGGGAGGAGGGCPLGENGTFGSPDGTATLGSCQFTFAGPNNNAAWQLPTGCVLSGTYNYKPDSSGSVNVTVTSFTPECSSVTVSTSFLCAYNFDDPDNIFLLCDDIATNSSNYLIGINTTFTRL